MSDQTLDVSKDLVLLLKAAIKPNPRLHIVLTDPKERESDYIEAMRHYLTEQPLIRKIVFVDNSGWPLDALRQDAEQHNREGKDLEFISLNCNDYPGEYGQGYGEALLLEEGMARSQLVRRGTHVANITGRLRIPNLVEVVRRAKQPFELLCDLRDHRIYDMLRLGWCGHHNDNRLVVFTPGFYNRVLRTSHHNIPAGASYDIEHAWHDEIKKVEHEPGVIVRFPIEPIFLGRAGHRAGRYDGPKQRMKQRIRGIVRVVMPSLRI